MRETSVTVMGDLEQIAHELGDAVTYDSSQGIENLAYRDDKSQITATQYPNGNKALSYHVDIAQVDFYISQLQTIKTGISRQIQKKLKRVQPQKPAEGQHLVGGYFTLADFSEISDLIRLHKQAA